MPVNFKSIDKNIVSLGLVSFFTDMASAMVTPLIPILVVHILNGDIQTLGQVVAIASFVSYAFRIIFGYVGDKYQLTKIFVVIGYTISALMKPLYYFSASWQGVATIQTAERMGKAIRSASKDSLISAYAKTNQSGKSFGFHKMMDIAGELFGGVLIFFVLYYLGDSESVIRNIFLFTVLPGVVAVFVVIFLVKDVPYQVKTNGLKWSSQDSVLLPILGFYFLFLFFIFSPAFYVIHATDLGYQIAMIPLLYIVLNFTQTITSYYFGLKIDQFGAINMLLLSFVFGISTLISFAFDYIWFAFVLLGLFTVASLNALRGFISHHAVNKSTMFGLFYGGTAISSSLGALLTGFLWNNFGVSLALKISIAGTILVTLFAFFYQHTISKHSVENT